MSKGLWCVFYLTCMSGCGFNFLFGGCFLWGWGGRGVLFVFALLLFLG